MKSSVIPARLQFQCGHAALVSLPRVKGETATQRNDRVAGEKVSALLRQCDFCAPSVVVLEPQLAVVAPLGDVVEPELVLADLQVEVEVAASFEPEPESLHQVEPEPETETIQGELILEAVIADMVAADTIDVEQPQDEQEDVAVTVAPHPVHKPRLVRRRRAPVTSAAPVAI